MEVNYYYFVLRSISAKFCSILENKFVNNAFLLKKIQIEYMQFNSYLISIKIFVCSYVQHEKNIIASVAFYLL